MPAALVAGLPFLVAAWLFALSPPESNVGPTVPQSIALICSVMAAIGILRIAPTIFLFNLPKRFVPPHLRDQPGFVTDRQRRSRPAR
jgi:hypothetical protein